MTASDDRPSTPSATSLGLTPERPLTCWCGAVTDHEMGGAVQCAVDSHHDPLYPGRQATIFDALAEGFTGNQRAV